jgi:hypothetical protein
MALYPAYQSIAQLRDEVTALRVTYANLEQSREVHKLVLEQLRRLEPVLHQIFPALAEVRELSDKMEYLRTAVILLRDADDPAGDDLWINRELTQLETASQANKELIFKKEKALELAREALKLAKASLAAAKAAEQERALNHTLQYPLSICDWHG